MPTASRQHSLLSNDVVMNPTEQPQDPDLQVLLLKHLGTLEVFVRMNLGPQLRSREETQDLVQSVCREILEDGDEFEYQGDQAFRSWLYMRCLRKLRDRARYHVAQKRDVRKVLKGDQDARIEDCYAKICSPSVNLRGEEFLDRFEREFSKLKPEQREAIALTRVANLTSAEAGAIMGCTESAVRSHVHRGLVKLSARLVD